VKLKFDILIDAGIDAVWAAFDNPDNMRRWQQNFHSYTRKSGVPGRPGSVAELRFDEKGKSVVLKETVMERRAPDFLAATYESAHATTVIVNRFEKVDDKTTRWTSWRRFSFRGFMRFMPLIISGVMRRRTEGDMQRFKLMVETDEAGSSA
jgi:uncharacterized protein YndB with AHSA1/START domain